MNDALQQARAESNQEIVQLRDTARALRDELERLKFTYAGDMQDKERLAREEIAGLRGTIAALRQQLDQVHAR